MIKSIKANPRTVSGSAGVYEIGEGCYVIAFVTETGRVIPVSGRVLTGEDLITAYNWGIADAKRAAVNGIDLPDDEDPETDSDGVPIGD